MSSKQGSGGKWDACFLVMVKHEVQLDLHLNLPDGGRLVRCKAESWNGWCFVDGDAERNLNEARSYRRQKLYKHNPIPKHK